MWAYRLVKWSNPIPLILAILGVFTPCQANDAFQVTAQYSVTEWGHKDGLPSTFVYAVAQTNDGFLWLGTADGLVRFDGVQFTPWHPARSNGRPLGQVRVLSVLSNGDLLLGTGTGLLEKMKSGDLQTEPLHSPVESIQQARNGSLWVATRTALWHLDPSTLQPLQPFVDLPEGWLSGPQQDRFGGEWITTEKGVFHVDSQGSLIQSDDRRSWLFRMGNGHLALIDQHGRVHPLNNEENDGLRSEVMPSASTIAGLTTDSDGNLWIALRGNGLVRQSTDGGQSSGQRFTRNDGLSSDFVRSVFEDKEHNLWVATEGGLDRLRRKNVLSLTVREGLINDTVNSIAGGKDGSVWLGTSAGLERMTDGEHVAHLRGVRILSLLMDRDQQLWAGTTKGLMQWKDGRIFPLRQDANFTAITALAEDTAGTLWFYDVDKGLYRQKPKRLPEAVADSSLAHHKVTAMQSGHGDEVWFGLENGNLVAYRSGVFHAYSPQDGLPGAEIHGLFAGAVGELWVATDGGLCFFTDEHFDCRNTQSGLPGDRVLWAIPDLAGDMWLGYNMGVAKLDSREIRSATDISGTTLRWKLFDDGDGIESSPVLEGNVPAVFAQDGRLWLTTSQGVAVFDPALLRTNPFPPPVHILEFVADGQEIDLSRRIRLRPLTRSIQFSFAGLSLSDPRKVRYRYRLDGFDREWHDGGSRREAFYTNLPPGPYVFRVDAANNDGVWNETGATLDFFIAPAYFQTTWFRLLCVLAAFVIAAIFFRVRLRSVQRNMRMQYEERVEERTRIAQELHDHLIQEMVGIGMQLEVADELTPGDVGAKKPLERALTLSHSAIAAGRLTLQSLRSHPTTGPALVGTLRRTEEVYGRADPTAAQYFIEGDERPLCPEIAEDLSEIGQEALRNALKHAGKGAITVQVSFGGTSLDLSVRDEGIGIDDAVMRTGVAGHYGLAGMRERAARMSAQFSIQSAPGRGTTVRVSVPATRAYQNDPDGSAGHGFRWWSWRIFHRRRR